MALCCGTQRRLCIPEVSGERLPETSQLSLAHTISYVKAKSYVVLARYRPRVYGGEIKFVKSDRDTYFPGDPVPVWANLAANPHAVEMARAQVLASRN